MFTQVYSYICVYTGVFMKGHMSKVTDVILQMYSYRCVYKDVFYTCVPESVSIDTGVFIMICLDRYIPTSVFTQVCS